VRLVLMTATTTHSGPKRSPATYCSKDTYKKICNKIRSLNSRLYETVRMSLRSFVMQTCTLSFYGCHRVLPSCVRSFDASSPPPHHAGSLSSKKYFFHKQKPRTKTSKQNRCSLIFTFDYQFTVSCSQRSSKKYFTTTSTSVRVISNKQPTYLLTLQQYWREKIDYRRRDLPLYLTLSIQLRTNTTYVCRVREKRILLLHFL
jgi:hypothetical protein